MEEIRVFYPESVKAWREWLLEHHLSERAVWVVFHKKNSGKPTITWSESVDVALCFGWIDSKKIKIDETTSHQFFSKRKPNGTWSKINKEKIEKLMVSGLMAEAGLAAIETAKQNGSWTILDEVEAFVIPDDLEAAFSIMPQSKDFFLEQGKSVRKAILQWLVLAKRPETRQKRITEIVELAALKQRPRHLQ